MMTSDGFPFPKDSPYLERFTEVLSELKITGQMHRLMVKYGIIKDQAVCERPQNVRVNKLY